MMIRPIIIIIWNCSRSAKKPRKTGDLTIKPQAKYAVVNCSETFSSMLPPGESKRRVGRTYHSDSAFRQINLVLVVIIMIAKTTTARALCSKHSSARSVY